MYTLRVAVRFSEDGKKMETAGQVVGKAKAFAVWPFRKHVYCPLF